MTDETPAAAPWDELRQLLGTAVHSQVEINGDRQLTAHLRPIVEHAPDGDMSVQRRWAFEVLSAAIERVEQSDRWLIVNEMDIQISVDEVQPPVFTLDGTCRIPPKFRADAQASLSVLRVDGGDRG